MMGVLNVTPDSFFDGGRYVRPEDAVAHGAELVAAGADVVDIGGESSRPGATPVSLEEELDRVLPVVRALAGLVRISIDTTKAEVARRAVDAGATLVNDISGMLWPVAADLGVGWVAMHMRGTPPDMQRAPHYTDVVGEVHGAVLDLADQAMGAGVPEVWVDPGIGFGKTVDHNLALLAALGALAAASARRGCQVLVGTSRKSFLGQISAAPGCHALSVHDRLEASLATAAWSMLAGAGMVRVHDVRETVQLASLVGGTR